VRPLRQPAPGTRTRPQTATPQYDPSSPSRISRRLPASSSFVLAAARLRALQLDPGHAAGRPGQLRGRSRRIARPHPGGQHVVTGLGSYALLTMVALMGAANKLPRRALACARDRRPGDLLNRTPHSPQSLAEVQDRRMVVGRDAEPGQAFDPMASWVMPGRLRGPASRLSGLIARRALVPRLRCRCCYDRGLATARSDRP
jgi:hypothetical protein